MGLFNSRDRNGENVNDPDYQGTAATAQSLNALNRTTKPLATPKGRDIKPLNGETTGRWYDADTN